MGRQQDAGIAFGEIHLNHGASILNRLFARVDGRGIMSHLGRSRRSPDGSARPLSTRRARSQPLAELTIPCLPNSAIGKVRLARSYGQQKFTNFARAARPTNFAKFMIFAERTCGPADARLADLLWRTRATIPERCKRIWVTRISSTLCGIPS